MDNNYQNPEFVSLFGGGWEQVMCNLMNYGMKVKSDLGVCQGFSSTVSSNWRPGHLSRELNSEDSNLNKTLPMTLKEGCSW